jgi:hypothetical protein
MQQRVGQRVCLAGDRIGLGLGRHRADQLIGLAPQRRRFRARRQGHDLRPRGSGELAHLGIFGRAHHTAVLHRASVIGGQVIEHLPGLRHRGGGVLRQCRQGGKHAQAQQQEGQAAREDANASSYHYRSIAISRGLCSGAWRAGFASAGTEIRFRSRLASARILLPRLRRKDH